MIEMPKSSKTMLKFLDGTCVEISGASVTRYICDARFIRFLVLASIVYATVLSYERGPTSSDLQNLFVDILLVVTLLGWLALSSCSLFYFAKRNWIRAVSTPLIFLPIPFLGALVTSAAGPFITSGIIEFSELSPSSIVRQLAIVVCFDMIHARFVAPMHSKVLKIKLQRPFSLSRVSVLASQENSGATSDQPFSSPIRNVQSFTTTVTIGSQVFEKNSLVSMRVEKGGLNVTTLTGERCTSAKFAETVETLGAGLGMRINSTSWVAFNAISSMAPMDNNRVEIKMRNGDRLMVPKFRKHSFEQTFQLYRKAA